MDWTKVIGQIDRVTAKKKPSPTRPDKWIYEARFTGVKKTLVLRSSVKDKPYLNAYAYDYPATSAHGIKGRFTFGKAPNKYGNAPIRTFKIQVICFKCHGEVTTVNGYTGCETCGADNALQDKNNPISRELGKMFFG